MLEKDLKKSEVWIDYESTEPRDVVTSMVGMPNISASLMGLVPADRLWTLLTLQPDAKYQLNSNFVTYRRKEWRKNERYSIHLQIKVTS